MDIFQLWELPAQLIRGRADSIHNIPHSVLQKVQRALVGGNDLLPVPLVDIDAVQVVQFLVAADGVHVSHQALAGAEAVLVQGVTFPFSQAVHHLSLLVQAGDIKGDWALHTVQVVVQAAALHDEQGSGHALQVQGHADLFLKDGLDQADGFLCVIQAQQALVVFRQSDLAHSSFLL